MGNKPVVSNNAYKLIISKDQDTIRSKSLHVPAEAYKVSPILKTVSKDSINIRLKIYFDQYAEGILDAYMFVVDSRMLFQGVDQDDNVVKSTSPCFKERIIDIACLKTAYRPISFCKIWPTEYYRSQYLFRMGY